MSHDELDAAYRATDFQVDGPEGRFVIRVGEVCGPLDELLTREASSAWAYITACNPGSRPLSDNENAGRMSKLEADVKTAGYHYFPGEGQGQFGDWPPEPSLLILGIGDAAAMELAHRYAQNAFVFGAIGEPARLVWTGQIQ